MIRRTLLASLLVLAMALPALASGKSRRNHDNDGRVVATGESTHTEYSSGDPVGNSAYRSVPKRSSHKKRKKAVRRTPAARVTIRTPSAETISDQADEDGDKPEPYAKTFKELTDKVQTLDELLAAAMNKNSEQDTTIESLKTENQTLKDELAKRPLPPGTTGETPPTVTTPPGTTTPPDANAPGTTPPGGAAGNAPQGAGNGQKAKVGPFRQNMWGFIGAGLALLLGTGFAWLKETDAAKKAQRAKIAVGFLIGNIILWIVSALAWAFPQPWL